MHTIPTEKTCVDIGISRMLFLVAGEINGSRLQYVIRA